MRFVVGVWAVGLIGTTIPSVGCLSLAGGSRLSQLSAPAVRLACSVDAAAIVEGTSEPLKLRAWALSSPGGELRYKWSTTVGQVRADAKEAEWSLQAVEHGPVPAEATVKVSLPSGESATCTVQVFVVANDRSVRHTWRDFLVRGKPEATGFGLYSYLLLGSRPTDSNRKLFNETIDAYLNAIEKVSNASKSVQKKNLNVALLMVQTVPPENPTSDWLVEHYDYARSRELLDLLPGNLQDGPYIVSFLQPLAPGNSAAPHLFQDLSKLPISEPEIITAWIREFVYQAGQERFWEPRTLETFVLDLRTTITVLADGFPEVQKGVATWISWTR